MAFSWRKKMVEKRDDEEEMSMEEILSSIRKYVIDEKGPAVVSTVAAPVVASRAPADSHYDNEDVIELTRPLEEISSLSKKAHQPMTAPVAVTPITPAVVTPILAATAARQNPVTSPTAATTGAPLPSPKVVTPSSPQQTARAANVQPAAVRQPQAPTQTKRQQHTPFQSAQYPFHPLPTLPHQQPKADELLTPNSLKMSDSSTQKHGDYAFRGPGTHESRDYSGIVSPKTASATAQAFSRLVEATQQQPAVDQKPQLTGDTTIEQLITEVTKPIIKTWLDQNLAPIVEAMVAKEIERIARG
jgi:cell pole-organizing protein PopZ